MTWEQIREQLLAAAFSYQATQMEINLQGEELPTDEPRMEIATEVLDRAVWEYAQKRFEEFQALEMGG